MSDGGAGGGAARSAPRLEAFSDGALAVVLGIMTLSLQRPRASRWAGAEPRLPELLTFAISLTFIASIWNNHHTSAAGHPSDQRTAAMAKSAAVQMRKTANPCPGESRAGGRLA